MSTLTPIVPSHIVTARLVDGTRGKPGVVAKQQKLLRW